MTARWLVDIDRPCPRCGSAVGRVGPGKGPHAAVLLCARCGWYLMWISKVTLAALERERQGAKPEPAGPPPPPADGPEFRQVPSGAPEFYVMVGSLKEGFAALRRRPDLEFWAWIGHPDGSGQLNAIPRAKRREDAP